MKLSNNALNFLLAQYRAIFKRAYVKGLASAVILTAGLAAGQAQAVDTNNTDDLYYYYNADSGKEKWYQAKSAASGNVNMILAGGIAGNGLDTKLDDTAGSNNAIQNPDQITGSSIVSDKVLILGSGDNFTNATIAGGWVQTSGSTAQALSNEVHVTSGATVSGTATYRGIIYGGYAANTDGSAIANSNTVEVKQGEFAATASAANHGIYGGYAIGTAGATANDNKVIINSGGTTQQIINSILDRGVVGGLAGSTLTGTNDGTYTASHNQIYINNFKVNEASAPLEIFGGKISLKDGDKFTANATGNTIELISGAISASGGSIAANRIRGTSGDAMVNGSVEGGVSVKISNSAITGKEDAAGNLYIYGSQIEVKGDVTANNNNVVLENTTLTHTHVAGANITNSGTQTIANNNTVSITDTKLKADEADRVLSSNIYGVMIENGTTDGSGASFTTTGNTVDIGNKLEVKGKVVAAEINGTKVKGVTANNNSVTFNGTLTTAAADTGSITGVAVNASADGLGTETAPTGMTFTGNTVTIGADAKLTNTNIIAVDLDDISATDHNDNIIHSGNNVIVEGYVNFRGENSNNAYSIAGDDVQISDNAVIYVQRGKLNISGLENGATDADIKYYNGTGTVAATAKLVNEDTINIFNSLKVEGDDSLIATKTGALLSINAGKAATNESFDDVTTDKAKLSISQAGLTGYLTATENKTYNLTEDITNLADAAGAVQVTSGGTLEFTDQSVVLSDFDFVVGAVANKQAGKILVDNQDGESIFKANELTVAHAFASNATSYKDQNQALNPIEDNGIVLQANTLNLGASGLHSSDSANIKFDHALVKETINFNAATSGNDSGAAAGTQNDGYHLTTKVIGSNFMKTNDQNSQLDYYTALAGNINGQVKIVSGGSLEIADGNWTANNQITVGAAGSLVVGADTQATDELDSGSLPDATLITNGLVLDVAATGEATIKADGTGYDPDVELGDNRSVVLDLTRGLSMKGATNNNVETIAGKATIEATNSGVVLLNASDVNAILGQNHRDNTDNTSGAFFKASNGGVLQVDGDVTATFGDFDGNENTNGFDLVAGAQNGILDVTTLTVRNENNEPQAGGSYSGDADYIGTAPVISFGGTVRVDDLYLNDEQLTIQTDGNNSTPVYASQVKVASGRMEVAKSLSSVNNTVILGANGSGAELVLNSDAVADEGTVNVNLLRVDSGSVYVKNGSWTAQDISLSGATTDLTVGGDPDVDVNGDDTAATLTLNNLTMAAGSTLNVAADGTATISTVDFTGVESGDIVVSGVLNINGATTSGDTTNGITFSDTEGAISIQNNGSLRFGSLATNGAILATSTTKSFIGSGSIDLVEGYTKIANDGGELYLDFASGTSFDSEAILTFKNELFTANSFADGVLKNGGLLNIGNASFEDFNITDRLEGEGLDGYTATWDQVKDFSDILGYTNDVTNNVKNQTNVRDIGLTDAVKGAWGSFSMEAGVAAGAQVDIDGNTWLNYATGNNGFFISTADHSAALGAKVGSQKGLYLIGGGAIGRITLENGSADVERNFTTLDISEGDTTIESINATGDTGTYATRVNVRSNTTVTGDITDVGEVNVLNGATLTTTNADINDLRVEESIANISDTLTVDGAGDEGGEALALGGSITAGSIVLQDNSDLTAVHGGTITAKTVEVANSSAGSILQIGTDIATITETISPDHENSYYNGTGYFEVSDYLELNGATLLVDPAYDENTSVAAVMNFKDGTDKTYSTDFNDVGIIDGKVLVGKNAALGIGATLADTREAIATYQQNGALDANKYGSLLYLNGQLTLDGNSEIALNSDAKVTTLEGIRDSLKYTITSQVQDQYADLGLGANTAILMTEAAFEDADGNKNGVAITFDRNNAVVNGAGGDIVLVGAFDAAQTLNFFKDNDGEGHQGAYIAGQDIKVYTQNGFLFTTLEAGTEAGYGEVLHVDKERAYQVMSEASDPVVATLISYHEDRLPQNDGSGDTGEEQGQTVAWTEIQAQNTTEPKTAQVEPIANENVDLTPIEPPVNNAPTTKVTGSSSFLNEVVTASHGAPAEQAARLGVYGGSAQVGLAASNSNADVLASRFGIGANAQSLNLASNGMGGTLWVAPIYKSQDSDGFAAQGLNYGVDFDLYGVALGGDYKVTNEITVGAMFNVGSGDLDGQGNTAASGVSNDFDYFGFALYGAYQAGALTVTADASFTQVDNDLEGNNELGKVSASADTTAWSLGVTGQYQFTFASIDVTPHAGLRFTALDLDDYGVNAAGHGNVANFDSDTMSVFSIPVGVTFAKSFKSETWTVTPALDLQVTGQFGDDEAEGAVSWSGTNLSTNVTSEVFDNFTYGATVGVEAQSVGGFSFGLGLGYTGSSNVDEFSAQANARFTF